MPIERSEGLTTSERRLKQVCDRTFLSLWTYPNLFTDKGRGQELCDALVVFGKHIIIFSDKECAFPNTGNLTRDWERWYRRSITNSIRQVIGAERWIRRFPTRIFLDQACRRPFPLRLPPLDQAMFHRVVVACGAAERCRKELGGTGSLMLMPQGEFGSSPPPFPFAVSDVGPKDAFVHVLNEVTLGILLAELDTIADLTAYFAAKESFVRAGHLLAAPGEEELLAYYLRYTSSANRHEFRVPDNTNGIALQEGFWNELQCRPEYVDKKEADNVSYVWDRLIERFNRHIAGGTLVLGNELGLNENELGVRMMASEPRTARRILGESIMELLNATAPTGQATRLHTLGQQRDVGYVFILEPRPAGLSVDDEQYRRRRRDKLTAYVLVAKHIQPQLNHVVGIATEPRGSNGASEDIIYLECANWSDEQDRAGRQLHEAGLFKNMRRSEATHYEFPDPPNGHGGTSRTEETRKKRNRRKRERKLGLRR